MKRKNSFIFYVKYFVVVLLIVELFFRLYHSVKLDSYGILTKPYSVIEKYYPGIDKATSEQIEDNNETIDILFLGGSVLHTDWGTIEHELEQQLSSTYSCHINIHNLAIPAHTSLDSRIKYNLLAHQQYDIVLLYHGINEVRFNNCPDDVFSDDYSHIEFYNQLNSITSPLSKVSILPYTYNLLKMRIRQKLGGKMLSQHAPNEEWLEYGSDIKTANSFYSNYKFIVEMAKKNNTAVVIPTFAYYIPEEYSFSKFRNKQLAYNLHKNSIEIWGNKDNVEKGIVTHNKAIHKLQADNSLVDNMFVIELNDSLTKNKKNFDDICHLTPDGSAEYVSLILPTIKRILAEENHCLTK